MAKIFVINHFHPLKKVISMKYSNKFNIIFATIGVVGLLLLNNSCSDNSVSAPSDIVFPDSNVSYTYHVQPLMKYTCATGGCHNAFDLKGGFALDTYYDLTTAYSGTMVWVGKPEQSLLIQILEQKVVHTPLLDFRINDNQIAGLKQWIKEGLKM